MKNILVPTKNVQRYSAAAKALEARLRDPEIQGMGLICGRPGLGKTMFTDAYYVRARREALVRVVKVRAQSIWTECSMLRYLLAALDLAPIAYRKDTLFDQLEAELRRDPALIIIDEIDSIAGSRKLISLLKDIHDMTGSAILMVGEERVDALLRRHESFYNRLNRSAMVQVSAHSEGDVAEVIGQRCDFEVSPEVCGEIHRTVGKSMRSVVDAIREIERICRTSRIKHFGMNQYQTMIGQATRGLQVISAEMPVAEAK